MSAPSTNAALSSARKRLIERVRENRYGRLLDFGVRDAEPILDPPPVEKRLYCFGRKTGAQGAGARQTVQLKRNVQELFEVFDRERNLHIEELRIEDGLPVSMIVRIERRA